MLGGIGRTTRASADDPVAMMMECHERIRRFARLGVRVVEPNVAPADEIREAARSVHRYFSVALPLHVADEDESIAPRLQADDRLSRPVREALVAMTAQHVTIDELLARALPLWAALAEGDPAAAAEARAQLDELAPRLATLLELHLAHEEELVLPAVQALPTETQVAIVAEMRARRATP